MTTKLAREEALTALMLVATGYSDTWASAFQSVRYAILSAPPTVRAALASPIEGADEAWNLRVDRAKWIAKYDPRSLIEAGWVPREVAELCCYFDRKRMPAEMISDAIAIWLASREKEKADAK